MTTTLAKGGNIPLPAGVCYVTLTSPTTGIDVSAVLLGKHGKVRSDDDLVFYNHPSQDRVALEGQTVIADLAAVPSTVDRIAIVASIDPELPATHFDASNTPQAGIECDGARISFVPPPLTNRETVAILVELYRRAGGWKARAVGQGWDTGLAGLATDVGIDVEDPRPSSPPPPAPMAPRTMAPLGKVALTKAGRATIDMRKDDPSLIVTATLEWDGGSAVRQKAGANLDLTCYTSPEVSLRPKGSARTRQTTSSTTANSDRSPHRPTSPWMATPECPAARRSRSVAPISRGTSSYAPTAL